MAADILWLTLLAAAVGQPDREPASASRLPEAPAFRQPGAKVRPFGPNLWVDFRPKGRRVILRAEVCLRAGVLEELMCLRGTKEHESVIAADVKPTLLHAALLAAGAQPGHPARFHRDGRYEPPTGDILKVAVEWKQNGKFRRLTAQQWVRRVDTKKATTADWVFAGSQWIINPVTKGKYYLGNEGDLISVANFAGSVIDLAMRSSTSNADLLFEAFTENIPPLGTEVFVILQPEKRLKGKPAAVPAKSGT